MKKILRWLALVLFVASLAVWLAGGLNRGWTKTSVPMPRKDPVTEQEYVEWEKRFVPGVELLGAGWLLGLTLYGLSFIKRTSKPQPGKREP